MMPMKFPTNIVVTISERSNQISAFKWTKRENRWKKASRSVEVLRRKEIRGMHILLKCNMGLTFFLENLQGCLAIMGIFWRGGTCMRKFALYRDKYSMQKFKNSSFMPTSEVTIKCITWKARKSPNNIQLRLEKIAYIYLEAKTCLHLGIDYGLKWNMRTTE